MVAENDPLGGSEHEPHARAQSRSQQQREEQRWLGLHWRG